MYKKVHEKEKTFRAKLNGLDISGKGLMLSINLKNEPRNKKIISKCVENGLITDWFLHSDYKLRIAPPLIISESEIKTACEIILNAIESVDKEGLA